MENPLTAAEDHGAPAGSPPAAPGAADPAEGRRDDLQGLLRFFDQAPGFMAMLRGPTHVFEHVNPGYSQLIGHRPVVGLPVREALPDIEGQGFYELLDDVYASGRAQSGSAVAVSVQRSADGPAEQRYVDFVYQPVRSAAGAVIGVLVQGYDVTERVNAESSVRDSDERHRQILDSAIDYAIIAFDLDGRITRWNEGAHRILGWTEAEMLGQEAERIFTPEDRAAGRARLEMMQAATGGVGNDERWHLHQSGRRFWASGEMTPLLDRDGTVTGFVKVLRDLTQEHRAAQELRQSEQRLRNAQQAGGVGTFTLDLQTNRISGTAEFYRLYGLDVEADTPAARFEALVIAEDAPVRSAAATRGDASAPLNVEYRIRRASDDALRWIARRAEYETGADGRPLRMVGAVQDITERKTAQLALQESAAQFRAFAQALPNQVWTAPPDGLLDWFNDRVYEYSGLTYDDLRGNGWAGIVHPDDLDAAAVLWRATLASGADYETEFRIRRADGMPRWHLVRALPLRGADGSVSRWVGTNTDIHERKLAEARSTRDRDRIWMLSQELMLVCDTAGTIAAVNPAATRILGWREDDMRGRTLAHFLHPADIDRTAAEVAKLAGGATTLAFENRYRASDGSYRLLNWTAVPDGELIHAVARDVTRERAAEDASRQSQKMEAVGQLTGGVAHDFNNLLTIIQTSITLMRRPGLSDERRTRSMELIGNAVTRATKLTGQLLAFARRQALQPVPFDAGRNVTAISEMIGTLAGSRIAVDVRLAEQPCIVNADPSQFDTAVVNMAVNARDAMDGVGRLTIGVQAVDEIPAIRSHPPVRGAYVAVSLADTGSGIAADHIDRIFEPFFTTKPIGLGTGLGLSQVFGFAKQSSGDVHVLSTPGVGTTFTLYLPQAPQSPATAQAQADAAPTLGDGRGACILVVEDNVEVATLVDETLTELGYRVVVAHGAADALAEVEHDAARFAAVFSDVVMPGMDGIQLAQEIRRRHATLPIVLSSGYSRTLATDDALGFELLPKPYSVEALSRVLRDAVNGVTPGVSSRHYDAAGALIGTIADDAVGSEAARQRELDSMQILDTEEEAAYDDLTRMAASLCNAPVALISLIDRDRQWFKSRVGLQARETPREDAFCARAIQDPQHVMVVNDATRDVRFVDNKLVTGDPNIRFYAGAPLLTTAGHALGTLCVIDYKKRDIDPKQLEMLQFLARQVVDRMEKRRRELSAPDRASAG